MYLKEDIIGASSRTIYGRKGDLIDILRYDVDICLVKNKGVKFFVRYEKISKEKVDPDSQTSKESTGKVQRTHKRKR